MDNELQVGPQAVYQNSSTQIQRDALNEVKELTAPERIAEIATARKHTYQPYTLPESRLEKIDPLSVKKRAQRRIKSPQHRGSIEQERLIKKYHDVRDKVRSTLPASHVDPDITTLINHPRRDVDAYIGYWITKIGIFLSPTLMLTTVMSFLYSAGDEGIINAIVNPVGHQGMVSVILTILTICTTIATVIAIADDGMKYIGEKDVKKITAHLDDTGYLNDHIFYDHQYHSLHYFVDITITDVMNTHAWASDQLANTRAQIDLVAERDEISQRLYELDGLKHRVMTATNKVDRSLIDDIEILTDSLMMRIAALHYWATRVHHLDDQFTKLANIEVRNALSEEIIAVASKLGRDALSSQRYLSMSEEIEAVCIQIDTLVQLLDPGAMTLESIDTSHLLSPPHNP